MKTMSCPACGGVIDSKIRSRLITCDYCGMRFALDDEEADAYLDEDFDYDDDEYIEEDEDLMDMDDFAEEECSNFLKKHGGSHFKDTPKIRKGLGIDDYEKVFLIHDDTIFKSGKNGFAITDYGVYCRNMDEEEARYYRWGDLADFGKPYVDAPHVMADGASLCYYTDGREMLPELCKVYKHLRKHAKNFDWSD